MSSAIRHLTLDIGHLQELWFRAFVIRVEPELLVRALRGQHSLGSIIVTNAVEIENERMSRQRLPIIRASEVGEYVYCARAWWLRRVAGLEPAGRERRKRGTALHRRHGRAVVGSRVLVVFGVALALAAALLILLSGR
jgi:hypothetical protein